MLNIADDTFSVRKPGTVTHIRRSPLPWRPSLITRCGRLVSRVGRCIDDVEFADLARSDWERSIREVCSTCSERPSVEWGKDPALMLSSLSSNDHEKGPTWLDLFALAELAERHFEEFDTIRTKIASTPSIFGAIGHD